MLEPKTVLQGRYVIDDKLGQGGMGAVYLATDMRFGATVALKQTLVSGEVLAKAFEREARLLNKLRHAALPVVIDYFAERDGQFLVMQFIPGEDFGALLTARAGAFPVRDVLVWADSLLDALDYLHTQDPPVVHRDIKPQNLKLTPRGEIVLLDFGLAKGAPIDLAKAAATGTSVFGYTPHYAPFEQVKGSGTDPRSDLYSLGATIYHLITGVVPPDAMTRAEAAMLRKPEPLQPADEVNPEIPPGVAAVLHKALALDRDERYPSAYEMRAALREAERGTALNMPQPKTRASGTPPAVSPNPLDGATVAAGSASIPNAEAVTTPMTAASVARPTTQRPWVLVGIVCALVALGAYAIYELRSHRAAAVAVPVDNATPSGTDFILTAPALSSFVFESVTLGATGVAERRQLVGQSYMVDLGTGATLEMVRVPAGTYKRGSPDNEEGRFTDEGPVTDVTVAECFVGRYEVTQAQWGAVAALPRVAIDLPADPSEFKGDDLPVENVTWDQAREFCARLSARAHRFYRLPSESEWEYACRGGTSTAFSFGDTIATDVANYDGQIAYGSGKTGEQRGKTRPVGSFKVANAFGLSDMHGNVWEWCFGEYHDTWAGAPVDGSSWLTGGDTRLRSCRGGAWNALAPDCRSANRFGQDVYDAPRAIGFRILMRPGAGDAWAKGK